MTLYSLGFDFIRINGSIDHLVLQNCAHCDCNKIATGVSYHRKDIKKGKSAVTVRDFYNNIIRYNSPRIVEAVCFTGGMGSSRKIDSNDNIKQIIKDFFVDHLPMLYENLPGLDYSGATM